MMGSFSTAKKNRDVADAIPVFDAARFGVGVLVEVHRTVPAARGKNLVLNVNAKRAG